ncbi:MULTISPECIES: MarR family winged helix-turn-helix transcriptional regulator [Flavobacterium]|uniref:MarR family transcriptional regulator n=1 Tax=Flavobacterium columnare TaxID=996 RepID=A0AA94EY55_9FLAO|nr:MULTISPECIES: MarR family winged helix-turn-helix transcriptional regulator [Flavobacterium]OXA83252.1 MarR family transcriptional regulator [Flavobacterium columnare NBRC 100251 = ATCC 23463]AMA49487.1 MarR family transcriptional regulator [Flavobacterium covae]AND63184.1 MarR family transcriptional regulator [Flavobacterium covae]MCH4828762.1 winged helix-turn-helix transcriptional regulator [Flavobacterium columnare]MCH4832016.1 winged helix-turn-helix transcriptional regulator [Flavobac
MKSVFNLKYQNLSIDNKIVAGLDKLATVHRYLIWEQSKKWALSPIQIQILIFIKYHDQKYSTVSYLAKEFGVTKPTISDAVKILEQKGLIEKIQDSNDSRSYCMKLTTNGCEIVLKVEDFTQPLQVFFEKQEISDKEVVWELLSKLIFKLTQIDVISVQRMCFSCKFYENKEDGHFCNLMQTHLKKTEIRMDCPEHIIP